MRFGGLIAAIVFAAVAAVIVLRMSANQETAPQVQSSGGDQAALKTVNVYVAAVAIPIGTTLAQEMVAIQPWPDHLVPEGFIRADSGTNIVGMVARGAFQVQEPFLASKLANPNDPNFLAGSLPKGMRVITLQTNEIEGVGGFVFPGDHVDIMFTHQITRWVTPPAAASASGSAAGAVQPREQATTITESLLTNVIVLATDQRASSSNTTDKNGNLIIPRSVSLMVSPTDAQRLRLAAQKGTLTLALRSLQDKESADPLIVTGPADISAAEEMTGGAASSGGSIAVVRGVNMTEAPYRGDDIMLTPNATQPAQIVRSTAVTPVPVVAIPVPTPQLPPEPAAAP
jgi:pilus assembly protein CpaB